MSSNRPDEHEPDPQGLPEEAPPEETPVGPKDDKPQPADGNVPIPPGPPDPPPDPPGGGG